MKNLKIKIIAASICLTGIYFWVSRDYTEKISVNTQSIKTSVIIPYDPAYNLRQTINDCAPFNAAAVVRALKGENVSSTEFAIQMPWRLPNKYTIPIGLEELLQEKGVTISTPDLAQVDDPAKIDYLKEQLSLGRPIIILGKQDNYQHYITLFGFSTADDQFYVYDSAFKKGSDNLTVDGNENLPGNKNMSSTELLTFWRGGGMYGLYTWYSLVAAN